jgi:phospholipid/cholesterol/gamma-HCH transport system permease protein
VGVVAGAARTAGAPPATPPGAGRTRVVPVFVRDIGGMLRLLALVVARAVRGPYTWLPEFVVQFRFTMRVCTFPLVLSAFALSFGPVGVQASGFFELFGTYDRMGSVYQLVVVRLFAPLVVGVILAGAAGTAMCAGLGARVVREETDALAVLGVDPVKHLVVPRVLALMVASVLFVVFAVIAGMLGALLVLQQHDAEVRPFLSTFLSNATPLELQAAIVKSAMFGVVIAIVCCYRGITVSGGPEGVGRAVNRSIVTCFLAIGFLDYVFTQLLLATNPELSQVRG